jgi:hypothetical protein
MTMPDKICVYEGEGWNPNEWHEFDGECAGGTLYLRADALPKTEGSVPLNITIQGKHPTCEVCEYGDGCVLYRLVRRHRDMTLDESPFYCAHHSLLKKGD